MTWASRTIGTKTKEAIATSSRRRHAGERPMAQGNCKLVGRWRIVEADIWDRDYLDLCGRR
jgi:hypothetical protein